MRAYAAVFLALSSFAFAQVQPVKKAGTTPSPDATYLSPNLLNQILALITDYGREGELPADVAKALGLTENNKPWPYRQVGARADESDPFNPLHVFAIHRGTDEDVLVYTLTNSVAHYIRANRNGQALWGIAIDDAQEKSGVISQADAQKEVNAEIEFWNRSAEKTRHWWACMSDYTGPAPEAAEKTFDGCTWLIQSGKETSAGVAKAYISRGMSYGLDNKEGALQDLKQATKVDPANATAWAALCSRQTWLGNPLQQAIQPCAKAIELNPHAPENWTTRGDVYLNGKEYDLAIADYDHAIKLKPDSTWPLDNRGEAYLRLGKIDRAIQDFNEVIRVSPDYAMGYLDRGIAQMRKNDLNAALADFQTGIKVDPKCAACFFGQGLVKRSKGETAGGDADIAKAKTLIPDPAEGFREDGIPVP